ncbi:hypothetical protein [Marinospirillum perlucidum]|uniref:hypothetical protein n=1 Tax=Marinospirillum perlucidum TaxID=1982602 RepID=UPI000DF1F814|nr:hypothetical protein [Marinospirillum perlucidum]
MMHTLYLGSPQGKAFTQDERQSIITITSRYFDGFTLLDAEGYYQGRPVTTLLVKVATAESKDVEALALALGKAMRQKEVAIEQGSSFTAIKTRDD